MSKAKKDDGLWDDGWNQGLEDGRTEGYAAGLHDGAKRERRALRRWINSINKRDRDGFESIGIIVLHDWLRTRAAKEKK